MVDFKVIGKFIYTFARLEMTLAQMNIAMGGSAVPYSIEFDALLDEFECRLGGLPMHAEEMASARDCVRQCRALCTFRTVLLASGEDLDMETATAYAEAAVAANEQVRRVEGDVNAACARRPA